MTATGAESLSLSIGPLTLQSNQQENTMPQYQIVTMNEGTGDWNPPIETFLADNDSDANAYAEAHYQALEWYILNESGENING